MEIAPQVQIMYFLNDTQQVSNLVLIVIHSVSGAAMYLPNNQQRRQLNISAATSSPAGSLISFQLTPSHIRGISLHFLTLSYGGGCFLGAFIIQLVYFLSGGEIRSDTGLHVFL